jgi:hypothetical protein
LQETNSSLEFDSESGFDFWGSQFQAWIGFLQFGISSWNPTWIFENKFQIQIHTQIRTPTKIQSQTSTIACSHIQIKLK